MNWRTLGLIALLAVLLFITAKVLGDVKAERINIKMSEVNIEKIEEVTRTIEGVIQTHWDDSTKELEIVFEQDVTSLQEIKQAISDAGFDIANNNALEEDRNPNIKKEEAYPTATQ